MLIQGEDAVESRAIGAIESWHDSAAFLRLGPKEMAELVQHGRGSTSKLLERLRILIMLGRPRTCIPGLIAFALGFSYTGAPPSGRMVLGALLAFSIGFSANLHNTATDVHEDSRNLPGRMLLLSKLGYRRLLGFTRGLGALMMLGAVLLGWYFAVFMALAVVGLHQYSSPPFRSKGRPLAGIWVFAQAVVFPFLFGWTTAPGRMLPVLLEALVAPLTGWAPPPPDAARQSFRYLGMWAFLTVWFMAKGAFKNIPDFEGDRAAGVRTSATVWSTQRTAALVAAGATVSAYLCLGGLVVLGLERPRVLFSLLWLVPVSVNCVCVVRAKTAAAANQVLKTDMLVSTGFIATLLLLIAPRPESLATIAMGGLILLVSDFFGLDSRRRVDAARGAVAS